MTETFNTKAAIAAQMKYCEEHDLPFFAPTPNCYRCCTDIYKEHAYIGRYGGVGARGISVERAGSEHITGCPYCGQTFCD